MESLLKGTEGRLIRWSLEAAADFADIRDYLTSNSPAAALSQSELIEQSIDQLSNFPESGPKTRRPKTRKMAVPRTPYLIFYRIHRDVVILERILHGAMRRPKTLH